MFWDNQARDGGERENDHHLQNSSVFGFTPGVPTTLMGVLLGGLTGIVPGLGSG